MFQGLGCSSIKALRELGSERRETVWSISGGGVRVLINLYLSTRGFGMIHRWYINSDVRWICWIATCIGV